MKVEQRRRQYRASIPGEGKASYQKKYDKAISGRDPQAAIAAKCLDCMYWQRSRITECPIVCCPLWPYRPFTGDQSLPTPPPARTSQKQPPRKAATAHRPLRPKTAKSKRRTR